MRNSSLSVAVPMNTTSVGNGKQEDVDNEGEELEIDEDKTGDVDDEGEEVEIDVGIKVVIQAKIGERSVGLHQPVPYMSSVTADLATATPRSPLGMVASKIIAMSGAATQSKAPSLTILSRAAS